jgi:GABA(A) receptor-associated protein
MLSFREVHPFGRRLEEAKRVKEKFPGRIPIIIERAQRNSDIPVLDKQKFLCPGDLTIGQFSYVVRKRMTLPPEKALFLFVNNTIPMTSQMIRELYAVHADKDGFLYVQYSGENTFGFAGENTFELEFTESYSEQANMPLQSVFVRPLD